MSHTVVEVIVSGICGPVEIVETSTGVCPPTEIVEVDQVIGNGTSGINGTSGTNGTSGSCGSSG